MASLGPPYPKASVLENVLPTCRLVLREGKHFSFLQLPHLRSYRLNIGDGVKKRAFGRKWPEEKSEIYRTYPLLPEPWTFSIRRLYPRQDWEYGIRGTRVTASGTDDSGKGNRRAQSARAHLLPWKSLSEGLLQLEQDQGEG